MRIIGLTGGIGSGKSTVSNYLTQKGFAIIDADKIPRAIVEPESETLFKLSECFGSNILNSDGSLNRKALAAIAFSSEEQKKKLDGIMLQEIIRIINEKIEYYHTTDEMLIFIDAPLLFEAGLDQQSHEIWVVDAEDELRIERVIRRDGSSREEVLSRMRKQMSREEQYKRADHVLNNSATAEALYAQIDKLLDMK